MAAANAQRNLTLSGVLAVGAAVSFLLVDCEASIFNLNLTGCAAPRFLQAPVSSLGLVGVVLGLAAGYLVVAVLTLFSLAALRHATRAAPLPASRSRKRPAAKEPAAAPAQAQARKATPAAPQTVSQQVAGPMPATCNRRSSPSQAPIVTEQALHRFLMQREGDRRGSAASASQLPSPNVGASPARGGGGWGTAASPIGMSPMPSANAVGSPPFPNPMAAANNPTSPFGGSPFGGSPGYGASPFASVPSAFSPAPFSGSPSGPGSSHSVRRASTSSVDGGGSATKYQRAMYIPTAGDRQEDPGVIARRASTLLQLLHVVDEKSGGSLMPIWRERLRKWMSAGLLQPLAGLLEFNQRRVAEIQAAAAKAPAPAAGLGAGGLGAPGLMRGAAPAANNPFALGGAKPAAGGLYGAPAATPEQQAKEAAEKRKKLADEAAMHQYFKLQSFLKVPGHEGQEGCEAYVRQRLLDLARGPCVSLYKWDGGAGPGSAAPWTNAFPTDAELLVHVFSTFLDLVLPPPADSAAKAPAPAPLGGGLGGSNPFAAGGGLAGGALGGANPFQVGGANPLGGAPAAAADKKGVFWEAWPLPPGRQHFYDEREGQRGFSARHFARSTDRQKKKSDVVLLQQPGSAAFNDGSSMRRNLPRYSVLCEGVEWVVAEGEHNVWEAIVLFLLQRAKSNGFLGGIDLKSPCQLYTAFMAAMHHDFKATSDWKPDSDVALHGLMSVLHPWSEALEQMAIDQVNERFSVS